MSISQNLFDIIPNITITNPKYIKKINKIGDVMSRPMPNRLIMGVTALFTQPYIESRNKKIDPETAQSSKNRIIGRIVAGTAVGCLVRQGVYSLISSCTKEDIQVDKWSNLLTPRIINKLPKSIIKNSMRNHRTALSTIIAMFVMLVTNVLLDMPLTNLIANMLNQKQRERVKSISQEDVRHKMLNTFNMKQKGGTA